MMLLKISKRKIYHNSNHFYYTTQIFSGINKIWIKIFFVTIIFALVQTTTPSSTLAPPPQKRGIFQHF
jgi:hypothetical protein